MFYWRNPDDDDEFLLAHIHVDDTRLTAASMQVRKACVDAWCLEFDEEIDDCATLSEDFAGVRYKCVDSST